MPPEQKRIIQSRDAEPDRGGSPVGALVFCVITVVLFVGVFISLLGSRRPDFLTLAPLGVLALAGIGGVAYQLWAGSDSGTYGPVPLELDAAGPGDGRHWRATVRLPRSASAAATVRAELLCYQISSVSGEWQNDLIWGKGSSFGIRWVYGEGTAGLVFEIPPGLPRSELFDPRAGDDRKFCKWELKLAAADLERNYDLDIVPAPAPAATPADGMPKAGATVVEIPEDELPVLPRDYSSAWVLVAANLVPIAGIAFWGWTVRDVVFLYFIETVIVGAYNALAMLIAQPYQMGWMRRQGIAPSGFELLASKLFQVPVFILHYGFFCYINGELLSSLILFNGTPQGANTLRPLLASTLHDPHALVAIAAMTVSHGYSFFRNYLGRGEYLHVDLKAMTERPYKRVIVTSLFVMGGGFALFAFNSPLVFVAVFVVIKIVVDAYYHLAERKALAERTG